MNDRFGINKKNNESNFNPLNDPVQNVYATPKYLYTDILKKIKENFQIYTEIIVIFQIIYR